jgi:hypothetical protein
MNRGAEETERKQPRNSDETKTSGNVIRVGIKGNAMIRARKDDAYRRARLGSVVCLTEGKERARAKDIATEEPATDGT